MSPLRQNARFLKQDGWYRAENAVLVGDVVIEEGVSIWYGCILRGDDARIHIGANTNIQDLTMVHADPGVPLIVEENVTVGHRAILHCRRIGRNSLIGMGAILLHDVEVGEGCIIGAGSVVPPGMKVPPHSLLKGVPGRVTRPTTDAERESILQSVEKYARNASDFHRLYGEVATGRDR